MPLVVLVYAAVLVFMGGSLCRVVRIARMPAQLRWELYPIPKGRRLHGSSYFEESEWWTKRAEPSNTSELAFILREVLLLKTLWDEHRPLWIWSWLMHLGLYAFFTAIAVGLIAAVRPAEVLVTLVTVILWTAMATGWIGTIGLLVLRTISPRLRPYTSRGTVLHLALIGVIFGTGLAALFLQPGTVRDLVAFSRSLLGMGASPQISWFATAHVAAVAVFLLYFPFTHMTHAFMKYFSFHSVRWDDAASVHDSKSADTLERNLSRPVTWSAAHIRSTGTNWLEVVSAEANSERDA